MAQVTKQEDADRTSPDEDTTVTNVGDGPERVVGPSGTDLEPKPSRGGNSGARPPVATKTDAASPGPGFFTIHKKGQGYWTRMGTALGAGLIIALTAWFFYQQLPVWLTPAFTPANATMEQSRAAVGSARTATIVICALLITGAAGLAWKLMNKPTNVDFLIATDSEMKKVNWTSRQELIGSTKVVIIFMFLIAFILFAIDILFGYFFKLIRVLDAGPFG
jgi:preprotein translocase SecE subunit